MTPNDSDHWLTRPATIRRLWVLFAAILAGTVLAELVWEVHGHVAAASFFGFNAIYGFAACVVTVLLAKAFGVLVKRPETYYDHASNGDIGEDRA